MQAKLGLFLLRSGEKTELGLFLASCYSLVALPSKKKKKLGGLTKVVPWTITNRRPPMTLTNPARPVFDLYGQLINQLKKSDLF